MKRIYHRIIDTLIRINIYFKEELLTSLIKGFFALLFGLILAYFWEYFKFKRETVFSKKIDLILDSREKNEELYVEFDRIRRGIWDEELQTKKAGKCDSVSQYQPYTKQLKVITRQLDNIAKFNYGIMDTTEVSKNVKLLSYDMKAYIKCLSEKGNCEICTEKYSELPSKFSNIINDHTKEINNQIGGN